MVNVGPLEEVPNHNGKTNLKNREKMKVHKIEAKKLVRLQFYDKSISFEGTDVETVLEVALNVFRNTKLKSEIKLVEHCPLTKPQGVLSVVMTIREEIGSVKGKSKSKTLYGLTGEEALEIFTNNYKKHLNQ